MKELWDTAADENDELMCDLRVTERYYAYLDNFIIINRLFVVIN